MGKVDHSIVGQRFGRLIVLSLDYIRNKSTWWLCKCDCGNLKSVYCGSLTSGDVVSCGCYHKEITKIKNSKNRSEEYKELRNKWHSMKQRTLSKTSDRFDAYGGRGITICEEWMNFNNFYNWAISSGYKCGLSIERKDVNGNYEPSNCTWIPMREQYDNKQNSYLITYNNETHCLSEWARILGVRHQTL